MSGNYQFGHLGEMHSESEVVAKVLHCTPEVVVWWDGSNDNYKENDHIYHALGRVSDHHFHDCYCHAHDSWSQNFCCMDVVSIRLKKI